MMVTPWITAQMQLRTVGRSARNAREQDGVV